MESSWWWAIASFLGAIGINILSNFADRFIVQRAGKTPEQLARKDPVADRIARQCAENHAVFQIHDARFQNVIFAWLYVLVTVFAVAFAAGWYSDSLSKQVPSWLSKTIVPAFLLAGVGFSLMLFLRTYWRRRRVISLTQHYLEQASQGVFMEGPKPTAPMVTVSVNCTHPTVETTTAQRPDDTRPPGDV